MKLRSIFLETTIKEKLFPLVVITTFVSRLCLISGPQISITTVSCNGESTEHKKYHLRTDNGTKGINHITISIEKIIPVLLEMMIIFLMLLRKLKLNVVVHSPIYFASWSAFLSRGSQWDSHYVLVISTFVS